MRLFHQIVLSVLTELTSPSGFPDVTCLPSARPPIAFIQLWALPAPEALPWGQGHICRASWANPHEAKTQGEGRGLSPVRFLLPSQDPMPPGKSKLPGGLPGEGSIPKEASDS